MNKHWGAFVGKNSAKLQEDLSRSYILSQATTYPKIFQIVSIIQGVSLQNVDILFLFMSQLLLFLGWEKEYDVENLLLALDIQ